MRKEKHTSIQEVNTTTPWISLMLEIVSLTECNQIGTWLSTSKEIFNINCFGNPGDTFNYTRTHNVSGSFAMVRYECWLLNWGTIECTSPAGKGVGLSLFSWVGVAGANWAWHNKDHFEGILPCVSMAGRALLARYHRLLVRPVLNKSIQL